MSKVLKIGWVLVREGVINRSQLDNILAVQEKHPDRTVGEITSDLFNIPEHEIETIFADQILAEAIKDWFNNEIEKKLKEYNVSEIVTGVEVDISQFTRNTIGQKQFSRAKDDYFHPVSEKEYLSRINCEVDRIALKTIFKKDISFENVVIEYDTQRQKLMFENDSLVVEAKIKLKQLVRKNAQK